MDEMSYGFVYEKPMKGYTTGKQVHKYCIELYKRAPRQVLPLYS